MQREVRQMHPLIAPADMLACEKAYFQSSGKPSILAMERAARALLNTALNRFGEARYICIACGPGGNGGDGYACARLLQEQGRHVIIFACAPAKSPDAVENAHRAAQCGVEIFSPERFSGMPRPDLWIDCLYGTGLSRAPQGAAAEIIRRINADHAQGCAVLACDIPSGLNAHNGHAFESCVQADVTLALHMAKYGHFLQDGLDMCGEICISDIGFPESAFPQTLPQRIESDDLRALLPVRRRNIHKGLCGRLIIIAGSVGMAGAAALCAKAALRSGAGLVSIACPEEIVPILQIHAPCATCIALPQRDGAISAQALPILKDALIGKSAVVIGPGLSRRTCADIVGAVLQSGLPTVVDADALNLIAESEALKLLLRPWHILTPHPGEAARLLGHACNDPLSDAQALSALGCTAVLKGASRVISAGKDCYISASGGCGMARGGSGDILSGILGAMLAEKNSHSPELIAACACEIHGLAGELAQKNYGARGMNAADIIDFLPEVFSSYEKR